MEITTDTKTVERHYTTIDGVEVRTSVAIDFLNEVEDTERMFPLRWSHKYDKVAEPLVEAGLVGRTNPGSWYAKDEDRIEELYDELCGELLGREGYE